MQCVQKKPSTENDSLVKRMEFDMSIDRYRDKYILSDMLNYIHHGSIYTSNSTSLYYEHYKNNSILLFNTLIHQFKVK